MHNNPAHMMQDKYSVKELNKTSLHFSPMDYLFWWNDRSCLLKINKVQTYDGTWKHDYVGISICCFLV